MNQEDVVVGKNSSEVAEKAPLVSVLVPVRNESENIEALLKSLLAQSYPTKSYEVLVIDGGSEDDTVDKVKQLAKQHSNLRLLNNTGGIAATALNIGIRESKGEVIVRVDGHGELALNFIEMSVKVLLSKKDADCVGGPIRHAGRTKFGRACALAMAHWITVGNAKQHFLDFEGYDQNVAFPGFRRRVFDRIGFFDETLVRNQDDEFIFRMKTNGMRTFISPLIRYTYYVRETPAQLFRQYFQYGFWRIPMTLKHRRPTSLRQIVPLTFLALVFAMILISLASSDSSYLGVLLPAAYMLVLLTAGVKIAFLQGPAIAGYFLLAIVVVHIAYASGMAYGWLCHFLNRAAFQNGHATSTLSR